MEERKTTVMHRLIGKGPLTHAHVETLHNALVEPSGDFLGKAVRDHDWGPNEAEYGEYKINTFALLQKNREAYLKLYDAMEKLRKSAPLLHEEGVLKGDEQPLVEEKGHSSLNFKVARQIREYMDTYKESLKKKP